MMNTPAPQQPDTPSTSKPAPRQAILTRETQETQIHLALDLNTTGPVKIETDLPFLSHMLHALAKHGRFALSINATGDVEVDPHHLVEDVGIALGQTLRMALTDESGNAFTGISRAGSFAFPMDQTLAVLALDLCGRPNLVWNVELGSLPIGTLDPHLFREFYKGFVDGLRATVHVHVPCRDNDHHVIEATFKALARALRQAWEPLDSGEVMSTKGVLDTH